MSFAKDTTLWDEFLTEWPVERVQQMTLEEYTNPNRADAFIYWIEKKLESLGSIWGGSAFKFGIYYRDNQEQKEALLVARDVAADILREVRDLAIELRPPLLDDLGLIAAIERYSKNFAERHGLAIELNVSGPPAPVDGQIAVALYRIVQESLSNVVKHSGATAVVISTAFRPDELRVTIADNGRGISDADLLRARQENRLGLYGMQERVELLQGRLSISKSALGGVELQIAIPQTPLAKEVQNEAET